MAEDREVVYMGVPAECAHAQETQRSLARLSSQKPTNGERTQLLFILCFVQAHPTQTTSLS